MLNFQVQKPWVKWSGAATVMAVILALLGYALFPGEPDIEPQAAIDKAIKNTERLKSYKYNIKMTTTIDGKQEPASDIKGEREEADRIHFNGKILDSEVDFYIIDESTYYKDQLTGEWTKMTNGELNQQDIFMQELNPLASFRYRELKNAVFFGTEKVSGKKCWVYTANASINNPYMEILWREFKCKFWITPGNFLVKKALITAVGKNKPEDKLILTVEFADFNTGIEITPPK